MGDAAGGGLDQIWDFNLAARDQIDLRDVAACLNFTAAQMADALVVLEYPKGAMVCAEVGSDLHKIMLVHDVTAKDLKQHAPWILQDVDDDAAENVSLDETLLPDALFSREQEEPIDIDVTVEVSEHFLKSVDAFVFNPTVATSDTDEAPENSQTDDTDVDIEAIVTSAGPTATDVLASLTAHNVSVDRIDVSEMAQRGDDAGAAF